MLFRSENLKTSSAHRRSLPPPARPHLQIFPPPSILEGTSFERVEIAGPGFINFFLSRNWFSLAFTNPLAMLVTFALKEVGKNNVTDDITKQIKNVLQKEKKENVMADAALMPAWIRTFTKQAYE